MHPEQYFIPPTVITFLTTYQCTAACRNCCFQCNPKLTQRLTWEEMKDYIDQSTEAYPDTLKVLVLTGGECFLLGDDLDRTVRYGHSKGLIVRVVSNGYWAKTYEQAESRLKKLIECGLSEINFSTGDDHQQWVPYENIVHGCRASIDLGLTCAVNIETHDQSEFGVNTFVKDERLAPYFDRKKYRKPLMVSCGAWIPFDRDAQITYDKIDIPDKCSRQGCESLFSTIAVNPYSELLACCGLTCEHILPLRLGNVKHRSIRELWNNQFRDFLKIWLYTEGAFRILEYVEGKRGIRRNLKGHVCHAYAELFRDEANIHYIQEHRDEIIPSVMFKYAFERETVLKILAR